MKFEKFKILTFLIATIICGVLTFTTLIATVAVDEGTEGVGISGIITLITSKLFYIFRFPTHTFSLYFMNGSRFFIGLFINCILYAFVTERLISFIKNRQVSK